MNKLTRILLGILIPLGTIFILVATFTARGPEAVLTELALSALLKYFALILTVTSTLLLLGKAAKTGSLSESLPLTLPAVIGLLILTPHWSLGIFISVVAAGHFTHLILSQKRLRSQPSADS